MKSKLSIIKALESISRATPIAIFILPFLISCSLPKEKDNKFETSDEPLYILVDSKSDEFLKSISKAKKSLPYFIKKLDSIPKTAISSVKIKITKDSVSSYTWLLFPEFNNNSCTAMVYDTPEELEPEYESGKWITIPEEEVFDWYILYENGDLEGGYSLRYQRSIISEGQRQEYDKYVGVKRYINHPHF